MYLEGIEVPFESAMIMNTPNGVELNIVVLPSQKLFDLKPKTSVQIFFRDWIGSNKSWRLLGEGFFSGFSKFDSASGSRSVSLICRDFRADIRKTPSIMTYAPDPTNLSYSGMYGANGIKKTYTTYIDEDGKKKTIGTVGRSWGGPLQPFSELILKIAGSSVSGARYLPDNNGRFFLDAFARGLWAESTAGATYTGFINSRIRMDKRLIVPENKAGYTFFDKDHLNKFGGSVVSNNSMFSSVEASIMRLGAIFQTRPWACSTPSFIDAKDAMDEKVYKYTVKDNSKSFGAPYVLTSSFLMPSLSFTAAPNCNIVFPSMYSEISWNHDYDSDITRGYFRTIHLFDAVTDPKASFGIGSSEVPNSLFKKAGKMPPITIDERYNGVNVMYSSLEDAIARREARRSYSYKYLKDYSTREEEVSLLKQQINANEIFTPTDPSESILKNLKKDLKNIEEKIKKDRSYNEKISKIRPTTADILDRHAMFKFLNSRYNGRSVSVTMDFNPYIVSGFPAVVLADKANSSFETLRTLTGTVVMIKHMISSAGSATTSIIINNVRFITEPTDMDDLGNKLYVESTDEEASAIFPDFEYVNHFSPPKGKPNGGIRPTPNDPVFDWKKDDNDSKNIWAKDILMVSDEELASGKSNASFIDRIYLPDQVMHFYEKMFKQDALKHFMVGSGENYFIYQSIHEAVYKNLLNKSAMDDYEDAIKFVRRDIVNEEQYFMGILGLSIKRDKDGETVYISKDKDYTNKSNEYYGVTEAKNTLKPGEFSSVYERKPLTPFLKERRDVVLKYNKEVSRNARFIG